MLSAKLIFLVALGQTPEPKPDAGRAGGETRLGELRRARSDEVVRKSGQQGAARAAVFAQVQGSRGTVAGQGHDQQDRRQPPASGIARSASTSKMPLLTTSSSRSANRWDSRSGSAEWRPALGEPLSATGPSRSANQDRFPSGRPSTGCARWASSHATINIKVRLVRGCRSRLWFCHTIRMAWPSPVLTTAPSTLV